MNRMNLTVISVGFTVAVGLSYLFLLSQISYLDDRVEREHAQLAFLLRVLGALERGVDYMWRHKDVLILDGVIGLRWTQGQLEAFLKNSGAAQRVSAVYGNIVPRLETLRDEAGKAADEALPFVKQDLGDKYKWFARMTDADFWTTWRDTRKLNMSLASPPRWPLGWEALTTSEKDDCLRDVLGTLKEDQTRCTYSNDSWTKMTTPGYRGYSLSHQLMFLLMGQQLGCFSEPRMRDEVALLAEGFCASMKEECDWIIEMRFLKKSDLFMEDQALCGMSGYRDFFSPRWVHNVLTWQLAPGCWGPARTKTDKRRRKKRREEALGEGCYVHRTTVALATLALSARFIIEEIASLL